MGLEIILDLKFTCIMRKSVEGLILQFANNFGKLVEDSSLDFLDVDSSKNVEGMNFLRNLQKHWFLKWGWTFIGWISARICHILACDWLNQFLKKTLFGLRNYRVKLQYFIKHLFPDLKSWEKVFDIFNNTISIS